MTDFLASLNEPQRATIDKLRRTLFWSHHTDVIVRKDGTDHHFEADWLRDALDRLCGPHPIVEQAKAAAAKVHRDAQPQPEQMARPTANFHRTR